MWKEEQMIILLQNRVRKIYNFDIENVILKVDGVYQCEVVGRKQPDGYEEAFAFVIFSEKENKDKVLSEVQRICKKKVKNRTDTC